MPAPHGVAIAASCSRQQLVQKRGRASETVVQGDSSRPECGVVRLGGGAMFAYLFVILAFQFRVRVLPQKGDVSAGRFGALAIEQYSTCEINHKGPSRVKWREGVTVEVSVFEASENEISLLQARRRMCEVGNTCKARRQPSISAHVTKEVLYPVVPI